MKPFLITLLAIGALGIMPRSLQAQEIVPYTRTFEATPSNEGKTIELAEISFPQATSLRLYFEEVELGPNSYLLLEGKAGIKQKLNEEALENWRNSSAYFNGTRITLAIFQAPGEAFHLRTKEVKKIIPQPGMANRAETSPDRLQVKQRQAQALPALPGFAQAVGRFSNGVTAHYTGWIANNGAIISSFNLARQGDPTCLGLDVIEFNMPLSNPDGSINHAHPDDQYPLGKSEFYVIAGGSLNGFGTELCSDNTTIVGGMRIDNFKGFGKETSFGKYGIIEALPNGTGKRPGERMGEFFQVVQPPTGPDMKDETLELYHCRYFPNTDLSQTVREMTFFAENARTRLSNLANEDRFLVYRRYDTNPLQHMESMSGAPITIANDQYPESNNYAFGVHNKYYGNAYSFGVNFRDANFRQKLSNFFSPNTRYVNTKSYWNSGNGSIDQPAITVVQGVGYTPNGGTLSIAKGTYDETMTLSQPMKLVAPVGLVRIGAPSTNKRNTRKARPIEPIVAEPISTLEQQLDQALSVFPNPIGSEAEIQFSIKEKEDIHLELYTSMGDLVATIFQGEKEKGLHSYPWQVSGPGGRPLPTGLYILKLTTDSKVESFSLLKR